MNPASSKLLKWYDQNKRDLPWRAPIKPYTTWLSEIILQQTRVDQGMDYYHRFLETYPTVNDLAKADEEEVLKLWQGLGYYSRARNLLKAAKQVVEDHGGKFPSTAAELLTLKGVGPYTAAAIASIAFGEKVAVVDGNVLRVIARLNGISEAVNSTQGAHKVKVGMEELITDLRPGDFNQAVMELGALICLPQNPKCNECPIQPHCVAYRDDLTAELPVKEKRTKVKNVWFYYFAIHHNNELLVRYRRTQGIWNKMYDLLCIESDRALNDDDLFSALTQTYPAPLHIETRSETFEHVLSHRKIEAVFFRASAEKKGKLHDPDLKWIANEDFEALPHPRLIEKALDFITDTRS